MPACLQSIVGTLARQFGIANLLEQQPQIRTGGGCVAMLRTEPPRSNCHSQIEIVPAQFEFSEVGNARIVQYLGTEEALRLLPLVLYGGCRVCGHG
jgi:hypothetical protein